MHFQPHRSEQPSRRIASRGPGHTLWRPQGVSGYSPSESRLGALVVLDEGKAASEASGEKAGFSLQRPRRAEESLVWSGKTFCGKAARCSSRWS